MFGDIFCGFSGRWGCGIRGGGIRGREGLHPSLGYYAPSGLVGSGLVDRAGLCIWVLLTFGGAKGCTPR